MKYYGSIIVSALILMGLTFGCRSLPNASATISRSESKTELGLSSSKGALTRKQSRAILERIRRTGPPTDVLQRAVAVIEAVAEYPLVKGNTATPLIDAVQAYADMFDSIRNARDHINAEFYMIEDDQVGNEFAELLLQQQARGVQVNIIYDSIGSNTTSSSYFRRLRDAGIRVTEFNRINPFTSEGKWGLLHRNHRKILIIDGTIAITGGINIGQVYSSSFYGQGGSESLPWRDTNVRIEGPAVAAMQRLFLDTWQKQNGYRLTDRNYLPRLEEKGDDLVRIIASKPGEENREPFLVFMSAMTFARYSIHLTHGYFIPDGQILKALSDAARRGVDVKIILPAAIDSGMVLHAQRHTYSRLLTAGVKIYERRDALLHAKTMVIDGVWSTVGSTNLDYWSLLHHDEANAVIISRKFAAAMENIFAQDLALSDEVTLEQWKKRALLQKVKESFTRLFIYWM